MALWMIEDTFEDRLLRNTLETSLVRCKSNFYPSGDRSRKAKHMRVRYIPVMVVKSKIRGQYRKHRDSDIGSVGVKSPKDPW